MYKLAEKAWLAYLNRSTAEAPPLNRCTPHTPEIDAVLAWWQNPPRGFDRHLRDFVKARLAELKAKPEKENAG